MSEFDVYKLFDPKKLSGRFAIFGALMTSLAVTGFVAILIGNSMRNSATARAKLITQEIYRVPAAQARLIFKTEAAGRDFAAHERLAGKIKEYKLSSAFSSFPGVHGWCELRVLRDRWYAESINFLHSEPIQFYARPEEG